MEKKKNASSSILEGPRSILEQGDKRYPKLLQETPHPPKRLYVIGDPQILGNGLAIVGARKATPYGLSCTKHFASLAAEKGITVVSGGARGCDSVSHEAALNHGARTVAILGGGLDHIYPPENRSLFQRIVEGGGALVSEQDWACPPLPQTFRARNRIIAGLCRATLIVEAGLPSGTFSTADAALAAGREVWVVPGAISSEASRGANRLLYQGALPIIDDESFTDALNFAFDSVMNAAPETNSSLSTQASQALLAALDAEILGIEALKTLASRYVCDQDPLTWLMVWLAEAQRDGLIAQYNDGRFGPCLKSGASKAKGRFSMLD